MPYREFGIPDMRPKIEEYIKELDAEVKRLDQWLIDNSEQKAFVIASVEGRRNAFIEVMADLQSRLNELVG